MITADQLVKHFGSLCAVNGVSFQIRRGECFGLLGPNGAGKSTTIHMLIGLTIPDRGRVEVAGASPSLAATRRMIGAAPQTLSLYEELTARENLTFFGRLFGLSGATLRQRVEWALDLADLQSRSRHRVSTYSGGMKRRLNIAIALIHNPQVLLLDEPTVGVDPQSRNYIFETIERLKSDGLTILYTTHYMEEAQRLCDRLAIMDQGQVLAEGSVPDLLQQYGGKKVVTAQVCERPSALLLPGTIHNDQLRFETTQPVEDLARLIDQGASFHSIQIAEPDLECVFLALTGKSLRD
ncbi:MAG TPA: ABC transporter ATP-binding protein [Pirellulaceae bacterium]|nr:ABC transporter ATP-binding protein [Pirellulaceae bacterium]